MQKPLDERSGHDAPAPQAHRSLEDEHQHHERASKQGEQHDPPLTQNAQQALGRNRRFFGRIDRGAGGGIAGDLHRRLGGRRSGGGCLSGRRRSGRRRSGTGRGRAGRHGRALMRATLLAEKTTEVNDYAIAAPWRGDIQRRSHAGILACRDGDRVEFKTMISSGWGRGPCRELPFRAAGASPLQ